MPRDGWCNCMRRCLPPLPGRRRVAEADRQFGQGTRSIAQDCLQGSAPVIAGRVVQRWCHRFGQGASHAIRSPGFGRMVVQQELRIAQCSGTRRCNIDCKARHSIEPRCSSVGVDNSRRTYGRDVQVVQDVRIDVWRMRHWCCHPEC